MQPRPLETAQILPSRRGSTRSVADALPVGLHCSLEGGSAAFLLAATNPFTEGDALSSMRVSR